MKGQLTGLLASMVGRTAQLDLEIIVFGVERGVDAGANSAHNYSQNGFQNQFSAQLGFGQALIIFLVVDIELKNLDELFFI